MMKDLVDEIRSYEIRSARDAVEMKYAVQGKLVSEWFSHSISTQDFMQALTLMYEKIMDDLVSVYFTSDICVIGFGKIGASEMNFSSDIDVCFVFRSGENEEKVIKEVRNFVLETTQRREGRFIWRLDLDLRPGGRSSPIAVSDSFFSWYYLNLGRLDDRYSLIRARPIAGDRIIGEKILHELTPFIFRRYLDFSVIERLKEIKILISRHLRAGVDEFDVKYSSGGIRELEFVASANQLIFGGKDPRFRTKRTTEVLEILDRERTKKPHRIALKDCYLFLREVESIIQLDEEHRFNLTEKDIPRILDFYRVSRDEFFERLEDVRRTVSDVFRETFETEEPEYRILTDDLSDQDVERYLLSLGYKDVKTASSIFRSLSERVSFLRERHRTFLQDSDISETASPERIVSAIIWYCSKVRNKDMALSYMSSFITSIGRRRGIYVMFFKNESILKTLTELMGSSAFFAKFLIRHPESVDTVFLSRKRSILPEDEDEFWTRVMSMETEAVLDEIRREKKEKILVTVMDDIGRKLDVFEISRRITRIYDFVVRETLSLTSRERLKLNLPPSSLEIPFVVIALGKYGSEEVIYGSDADMVFSFYDEDEMEFWLKFSQKFLNFVMAKTKEGDGLQVDMRLRPSGKAGPLAISKRAMVSFYMETDNVWEVVPLLKARVVFDGLGDFRRFLRDLRERALMRFGLRRVKDEMLRIRNKALEHLGRKVEGDTVYSNVKHCEGGLYDFELITSVLQIEAGMFDVSFKDAIFMISEKVGTELIRAYEILRGVEKFVKLRSDVPLEEIWVPQDPRSEFWEELREFEGIGYEDFERSTKLVSEVFRQVMS